MKKRLIVKFSVQISCLMHTPPEHQLPPDLLHRYLISALCVCVYLCVIGLCVYCKVPFYGCNRLPAYDELRLFW